MNKTNKNRRGGDKQHSNTVPNQTPESTNKHPKMCTIERNGTNESNTCGKPKKIRILYGTPQQRRKQARSKNENTSRKERNAICERNWGTKKILQYKRRSKKNRS